MSGAVLLRACSVSKRFTRARSLLDRVRARPPGTVQALSAVTLDVSAGETVSVVGESGSGKSTLARCMTGLTRCDSGLVTYRDRSLADMGRAERRAFHRRVQPLFQNPLGALNPRMSVRQALGEALRVHRICPPGAIEDEMASLLDRVRLPASVLGRRPHAFSGGQLQRIALARALSVRPEIIVADEMVSALDVSVAAQIVNLLITLQRELGLALVFIAHDLRLVRHVSHRVAVMYRGTLVEMGVSEDVFVWPLHPYTRLLIGSAPTLDPPRPSPVRMENRAAVSGGCAFRPACPAAEARCAVEAPALRRVEAGRLVACHVIPADARTD